MSRFFVGRPIVAMVIAILTVIIGAVAMVGLPIAQYPNIVPPQIQVRTSYTGADAITVEQSVATPVEQQMSSVKDMLYMQSTNSNDGSFTLQVTFDVESSIDIDQVNTQNKAAQAQALLPADVTNFGLTYLQSTGLPLIAFSLYSPKGTHDPLFLGNYANININDTLQRVPGVGQIRIFGTFDYAMRIWVKPDRLANLGFTVSDLVAAVQAQNNVNPSGRLGGPPSPTGQQFTYTVRAQGRLLKPEEFGDVVVRLNPDGSTVRLRDVARIELGALDYTQIGRLNGQPSAVIAIFQTPGSNALAVAKGPKATMQQLKQRFPADLDYQISLDTTAPITGGIREIIITLLETTLLVALVVFLFLQSWRATLIPLLAVPVSLVGTFAVFPLLGFSLNTLSLFGLILAIGLVVDDAIVVVEHHIEKGLSPREATLKAMHEVTGPVIGIALVLSSVFIPVAFIPGITGRLYQQFALTIAISVLISAFNALTLSPALSALLLRSKHGDTGLMARFGKWFNVRFDKMTGGYVKISAGLVRKTVLSMGLLLAVALIAGFTGSRIPTGFVPTEDQGYALAAIQLPDAASLQRTRDLGKKVEEILAKTPGVRSYTVVSGYNILTGTASSYLGTIFIAFHDWADRKHENESAAGIVRALNVAFSKVPEARLFAFQPPAIPGIGTAGGANMMLQDRSGKSIEFLAQNVGKFLAAARKRPELQAVTANFSPAVPQIFVEVDKDKVLKQGVALTDVYGAMQAFLGGSYINDFTRFGRQWKVFLQAEGAARVKSQDINSFYVRNRTGDMVPLSTLVTIKNVSGPEFTVRFNLFRSAELLGSVAPGYSSGQALKAFEEVFAQTQPPEMGYAWTNLSFQEKASEGGTAAVFGLALVFVFLILAALYESWSLPFSVLLSTPIAVMGAFLGLLVRRFDFDVYGQIGLVMLIGLAAKNAILIVEFAKMKHEQEGMDIVEAALEGARLRLRPILMTSFAFILGCVPLWIAAGAGAASRRILGTAVIAGMSMVTLLGVFIVPVLYVVVEKLAGGKKGGAQPAPAQAHGGGATAVAKGEHP